MAISLNIDKATCIKCGKCAKVCPAGIFTQTDKQADVEIDNIQTCIACGHCAAVCPTSSIRHSDFPPTKVHSIDRSQMPTPEQIMLLCKARRSNRAISRKPVPEAMLEMILEAAHRAPTASNMQQVGFTLVTDPEKLRKIRQYTIDVFMEVVRRLENPILKPVLKLIVPNIYKMIPRLRKLNEEFIKGNDPILRGGTALIFIHTPADNRFGRDDCNLAYQNGSLMAESLGVSQIYTGFVLSAIRQDKKDRVAEMLGIKGKIHAGMSLGMPEFLYPNYIDKKEIAVDKK